MRALASVPVDLAFLHRLIDTILRLNRRFWRLGVLAFWVLGFGVFGVYIGHYANNLGF